VATTATKFRKKANVRLRPMGEWGGLLAYTPDQPNVVCLNGTSWIILELANEATAVPDAREQFVQLMNDVTEPEAAREIFDQGIEVLEQRGIIEPVLDQVEV
jgi:hypothetical protein